MDGNGRDDTGRFQEGHPGGSGRKPNGVAAALRRMTDPDEVAAYVLSVLHDEKAPRASRQWAAEYIADRIDGKPHQSQSTKLELESTVTHQLPADYHERQRYLDALRAKVLAAGSR